MGNSPFANAGSPKTNGERPWGGGGGWGRGGALGDGTRGLKEAVRPLSLRPGCQHPLVTGRGQVEVSLLQDQYH